LFALFQAFSDHKRRYDFDNLRILFNKAPEFIVEVLLAYQVI